MKKKLYEEKGPYQYEPWCEQAADSIENGDVQGDLYYGYSYGPILINGEDASTFFKSDDVKSLILRDISYPVKDGHASYSGLDEIIGTYSSLDFSDPDVQADLIKLGFDEDGIKSLANHQGDEDEEIETWIDYDIQIDDSNVENEDDEYDYEDDNDMVDEYEKDEVEESMGDKNIYKENTEIAYNEDIDGHIRRNSDLEQSCQGMIESIIAYYWTGGSGKELLDKEINSKYTSYLKKYVDELGYDRVLEMINETLDSIENINRSVGYDNEGGSYNSISWKKNEVEESYPKRQLPNNDDWNYIEGDVVSDKNGNKWTIKHIRFFGLRDDDVVLMIDSPILGHIEKTEPRVRFEKLYKPVEESSYFGKNPVCKDKRIGADDPSEDGAEATSEAVERQPDMFGAEDTVYKDGVEAQDFDNILDAVQQIAPKMGFVDGWDKGDYYVMKFEGENIDKKRFEDIKSQLIAKFGDGLKVQWGYHQYSPEQKSLFVAFIDRANFDNEELAEGIKDYLPRGGFMRDDEDDKSSHKTGAWFGQGTDEQIKMAKIIAKVKFAHGDRMGRVSSEDLKHFDEYKKEYDEIYGSDELDEGWKDNLKKAAGVAAVASGLMAGSANAANMQDPYDDRAPHPEQSELFKDAVYVNQYEDKVIDKNGNEYTMNQWADLVAGENPFDDNDYPPEFIDDEENSEQINESQNLMEGTANFRMFDSPNLAFTDEEVEDNDLYNELISVRELPDWCEEKDTMLVESTLDDNFAIVAARGGYYEGMNIGVISNDEFSEWAHHYYEEVDGVYYEYNSDEPITEEEMRKMFDEHVEEEYNKGVETLHYINEKWGGRFITVASRASNGETIYSEINEASDPSEVAEEPAQKPEGDTKSQDISKSPINDTEVDIDDIEVRNTAWEELDLSGIMSKIEKAEKESTLGGDTAENTNISLRTSSAKSTNSEMKPSENKKQEKSKEPEIDKTDQKERIEKAEKTKAEIHEGFEFKFINEAEGNDIISFEITNGDGFPCKVEITNKSSGQFTADELKKVIERENPSIWFNDAEAKYWFMDFSFEKGGKTYWMSSDNIEGDMSKYELSIYDGNDYGNDDDDKKLNEAQITGQDSPSGIEFLKTLDDKGRYMFLSRMQSDCKYFLDGHEYNKFLWAGNVEDQIKYMKWLYNSFPKNKKPEWISMEEIEDYEKRMAGKGKEDHSRDEIDEEKDYLSLSHFLAFDNMPSSWWKQEFENASKSKRFDREWVEYLRHKYEEAVKKEKSGKLNESIDANKNIYNPSLILQAYDIEHNWYESEGKGDDDQLPEIMVFVINGDDIVDTKRINRNEIGSYKGNDNEYVLFRNRDSGSVLTDYDLMSIDNFVKYWNNDYYGKLNEEEMLDEGKARLDSLHKLMNKCWYDGDGQYAKIGNWEMGLGGYDLGYEFYYAGRAIFAIDRYNVIEFYQDSEDTKKITGYTNKQIFDALKEYNDLSNLKLDIETYNYYGEKEGFTEKDVEKVYESSRLKELASKMVLYEADESSVAKVKINSVKFEGKEGAQDDKNWVEGKTYSFEEFQKLVYEYDYAVWNQADRMGYDKLWYSADITIEHNGKKENTTYQGRLDLGDGQSDIKYVSLPYLMKYYIAKSLGIDENQVEILNPEVPYDSKAFAAKYGTHEENLDKFLADKASEIKTPKYSKDSDNITPEEIEVGDYFADNDSNSFYRVVRRSKASVWLEKVKSKVIRVPYKNNRGELEYDNDAYPTTEPDNEDRWSWFDTSKPFRLGGYGHYVSASQGRHSLWFWGGKEIAESFAKKGKALMEDEEVLPEADQQFENPFKEGDILFSSWGYGMTLVDFYKVIASSKSFVKLTHLADYNASQDEWGQAGKKMPKIDQTEPDSNVDGRRFKVHIRDDGKAFVKINNYEWAEKWDGKPKSFDTYD